MIYIKMEFLIRSLYLLLVLYGVTETCSGCWIQSLLLLEHAIFFLCSQGLKMHICSYSETDITSGHSRPGKNLKKISSG